MEYRVSCPVCDIWGEVVSSGNDCTITINGGEAHVGCVVLAIPRPSLTGHGISATVSVLNRTGHMDDALACEVAKQIASSRNCVVACSCGIHVDHASAEAITQIRETIPRIVEDILALLERKGHTNPTSQFKSYTKLSLHTQHSVIKEALAHFVLGLPKGGLYEQDSRLAHHA